MIKMRENNLEIDHCYNIFNRKISYRLVKPSGVSAFKKNGLHTKDYFFRRQIGKLISSYTQSFNKVYHRSGPLFESPFKRILIDSEEYLRNLVAYIHQNPENFQNYKFSSYLALISDVQTNVRRSEVIELFGDRENFIENHNKELNTNFVKVENL